MNTSTTSHKVSESLYLVRQTINKTAPKKVAVSPPINHIAVIDCSGSMYRDLPRIREQLKKRIPKLLGERDTLSVIWFSGRNQFGTLLECEPVSTLVDLQEVNQAIDRWLKPVCLTGFKQPIEEAAKLVARIQKKNNGSFALFFMSDGHDNQWNRQEILRTVEASTGDIASCTFVEYGYYADRPLLTAMATKAGGTLIFAKAFDQYAPMFEAALQKKVSGAPRVEVIIEGDAIGGFAFNGDATDLYSFEVNAGKISIPKDNVEVAYLSPTPVGDVRRDLVDISKDGSIPGAAGTADLASLEPAYAAVSLFSLRMQPDVVLPLLKALGDVAFIEKFGGCFGKQKYTEFMEGAKAAAFGKDRFVLGWDPTKVPEDDAFTVLDFLQVLASDNDNRVLLDHPDFKYSRIGRGTQAAPPKLTGAEMAEMKELSGKIAKATDVAKLQKLQERVAEITNAKRPDPLKFTATQVKGGYAVSSLTWNEKRPNVSFLVRKEGTVDLTNDLPKSLGKVPTTLPSYIHRNYAVVKDGLVNVERLPVRMTGGTVRELRKQGMPLTAVVNPEGETLEQTVTRVKKASKDRPVTFVIDLTQLPIINRQMVQNASAKMLFEKMLAVTKARAVQKVFNSILKAEFPKTSEGFKQLYGEEAATWLKEQGVTDYNGFNPRVVQAEASDYYMARELHVKLKGLSTIPSLNDVKKRMASGKLTAGATLMVLAVKEVEAFLASDLYKKTAGRKKEPSEAAQTMFKDWLLGKKAEATKVVRGLLFELAQIRFSVIVGQTWFKEFKSLDENTMDITHDGAKLACTVETKEVQVKV